MDFVEGEVRGGTFSAAEVNFPLGEVGYEGRATLGFRPEHVTVDSTHPRLANVTLEVVERMGHETIVYFQIANTPMVARLEGNAPYNPGDQLELHLPDDCWHLFAVNGQQKRIS